MATDQDRNNPAKILTNQNNLAAFGFKLVIDGTPSFHFQRTFTKPFLNAIGRIVCDGFSLRDTYDGNSAANMSGRHHFVPSQLVNGAMLPLGMINGINQVRANADQERQEQARVRRLFMVLMEHVLPSCFLYRELNDEFANEGCLAVQHVIQCCTKDLTPEMKTRIEAEWEYYKKG